ncbi:MAG: ABC transporter permease [Sphaerochaeta sp.]|jgi:osmoprotectant transport system permease protein|uniref:ABC transporter permease n=1 Tax=Sphaerochaeta sp. TaxID=1972642 RepID=UPI00185BB333|nr:ABC transporter permease [Sphaerochaeta sp.]MDT3360019.1 ABC transporter permease [Spirochaetota bacterium]NLA98353.1 ABC transporter permease [Spirochaetales bacterium]MDD3424758.1 ABC transporter permease [Sphaerochaeta sp.]MDD4038628.1 ABC transporter permease [Sphaerochaeta sp.]MDD4450745.1 ABC transporter permease [Sphaerochaeta sp.]
MNELMTAIAEHLTIVAISMVFAAIIGIALGVFSYWKPRVGRYIIGIAEIIQTIPSLALLALLMIIFGLGDLTMGVALVLYALLPIIRNTYTSLTELPPYIIDAARGMGMSRQQRLVKVEIPLSIPMIFGGLKVALVNSLSIAVMGVLIGSGGLGYIIYRGIQQRNMDRILLGAIPVVVIALIFDWGMGKAEKRLQKHAR